MARSTCDGSGIPEVQADPVEAAKLGLQRPQEFLRDKAVKSQVGIAGVIAGRLSVR